MTDSKILSGAGMQVSARIMDAFSNLNKLDRRVTKLVVPPRVFKVLREEHQLYADVPVDGMMPYMKAFKREVAVDGGSSTGFDTKCGLWGANIIIGDQFRAYAEDPQMLTISTPIPYGPFFENLTIIVKTRACTTYGFHNIGPCEQKARDTLREMISESDYRKYLRYGFILTTGRSGKIYQIFAYGHTKVWEQGVLSDEICVMLKNDKIPHTDRVIALKTMIECSEEEFYRMGNVYKMRKAA
jgi:hypothetical protein